MDMIIVIVVVVSEVNLYLSYSVLFDVAISTLLYIKIIQE